MLGDKYSETKLLSYFIRAAKGLTKVERAGNGTTNFTTTNPQVFAQALRNVDTNSHFYVVKNANTTLTSYLAFKLTMSTSVGNITVPRYAPHIALDGRQAKILVADFDAGSQKIIYSTSEILAVSVQDEKPIIVVWVPTGMYIHDLGCLANGPARGLDTMLTSVDRRTWRVLPQGGETGQDRSMQWMRKGQVPPSKRRLDC